MLLVLGVIKLHVVHVNLSSGDPSSLIGHAGCSGSVTVCESVRERCLNRSTISFRSLAGVACCSRRCLSRLINLVQCSLHTSTPKSSKKQRISSQLSSDISFGVRRGGGLLLLLSAPCGAGARLS